MFGVFQGVFSFFSYALVVGYMHDLHPKLSLFLSIFLTIRGLLDNAYVERAIRNAA